MCHVAKFGFCQDCWWRFTTVFRYESLVGVTDPEDETFRLLYSVGNYWPVDTALTSQKSWIFDLFLISATNVICVTSGFWCGVSEICALERSDAPYSGADKLSRNVGTKLPFSNASNPQNNADLKSLFASPEFSNCVIECTKFITNFEKVWRH